ncbi:MAG: hypothetical protein PSY14_04475 [bacterium]|nr:hypothetical protein [bacterium]
MDKTFSDKSVLEKIWRQQSIPVFYRKGKGHPLLIRLPYRDDNREWLKNEKRHKPVWDRDKKHWEVPKAWFNDLVNRAMLRWKKLYIIQPYLEKEVCAPACWNAVGHECQCSCMGERHGSGHPQGNWFTVSDTFAVNWSGREIACRLLTAKSTSQKSHK